MYAMWMKNPQCILITGASSGIGTALAQYYAAPDVILALTGRNQERLDKVCEQCKEKGAEVHSAILDVINRDAMHSWLIEQDNKTPFDLVIANAGISGGTGGNDLEPFEQVRMIMDINFTGLLNTVEPLLPSFVSRGKGQIALMSSLASFSGWPGAPAYSSSKGAVRFYGESMRGNLAKLGVEMNVICPGFIRTPMTDVNDYPMPFMMDADKAALIIAKGLEKNKGRIAFPWQTFALAGFFGMLPHFISSWIFNKLPEKPSSM